MSNKFRNRSDEQIEYSSVVLSVASLGKKIQRIVCGCMCVSRCVLTVNQILNIVLLDWLHINKVGKKKDPRISFKL